MHSAFAQFRAIHQKDEADNLKAMETEADDAGARHRRREGLRRQRGVVMRNAATKRSGSRYIERRPLADGGSARGDDRRVKDFLTAH